MPMNFVDVENRGQKTMGRKKGDSWRRNHQK